MWDELKSPIKGCLLIKEELCTLPPGSESHRYPDTSKTITTGVHISMECTAMSIMSIKYCKIHAGEHFAE
jgi:hypothetical protein